MLFSDFHAQGTAWRKLSQNKVTLNRHPSAWVGGTLHSISFPRNGGGWHLSPSSQEGGHWEVLCVYRA